MEVSRKVMPLAVSTQTLWLLQPTEMGSIILLAQDVHIKFLNPAYPSELGAVPITNPPTAGQVPSQVHESCVTLGAKP